MNSVNLTGNICNDLELKHTNSGKAVMQINLAVKRPYAKDTTDFLPIVVWGQSAEYLSTYGKKGARIEVTGKLTSRNWEDKDGNKRTSYEVIADSVAILNSGASNAQNDAQPFFANVEAVPFEEGTGDNLPF